MSKLIVEMEMPKRCIECGVRLKCKRYICGLQQDTAENLKPLISDKDCLIEGVLSEEHGDLIDRDALKERFVDNGQDIDTLDVIDIINNAKAVIVAERKDGGTSN